MVASARVPGAEIRRRLTPPHRAGLSGAATTRETMMENLPTIAGAAAMAVERAATRSSAARLAAMLHRAGWSSGTLRDVLQLVERTPRAWLSGRMEIPDGVIPWMEGIVAAVERMPDGWTCGSGLADRDGRY